MLTSLKFFFFPTIFFQEKYLLGGGNFCQGKNCQKKNFFEKKFFSCQKICWKKFCWEKIFPNKICQGKIFCWEKNCLEKISLKKKILSEKKNVMDFVADFVLDKSMLIFTLLHTGSCNHLILVMIQISDNKTQMSHSNSDDVSLTRSCKT